MFGEQLVGWLFTDTMILGGIACGLFYLILLTHIRAVRKASTVALCLVKTVVTIAAFFLGTFFGICIGYLISDEWRAFLQQYVGMFAMAAAACILFRDYKVQTRVVYAGLFTTTWVLAAGFNFLVSDWFHVPPPFGRFSLLFVLPRLVTCLVLVGVLKLFNIDKYEGNSNYGVYLFCALCAVVCLLQTFTFFSSSELSSVNYFSLWIWIMEMAAYAFYYLFLRENDRYTFYKVESSRLAGDLHYYRWMQNYFDEMRMLKHDMQNQFSYVRLLYEQGKDADAKEYFAELDKTAQQTLDFVSTGNKPVDTVLNMTITRAHQVQVELEHSCSVPQSMRFHNRELFSLLINLCDNAVEAARLAPEGQRRVKIDLYSNDNNLLIYIANSFDAKADVKQMLSMERSTKRDAARHGYGHRIVKNIVQKYDGDILYTVEGGLFVAKAMLALHDAKSLPGGKK